MKIEVYKKDVFLSYLTSILTSGLNILILPLILNKLNINELAAYYIFITIQSFILIFDFGLTPSISRAMTLAWSGASDLLANGIDDRKEYYKTNIDLLKSIIVSSTYLFIGISIIAIFSLLLITFLYIDTVLPLTNTLNIATWITFMFSIILSLFFGFWPVVLKSIGGIKYSSYSILASKAIYVISIYIFIGKGFGLLAITIGMVVSNLFLGFLSILLFFKIVLKVEPDYFKLRSWRFDLDVVKKLLPNSFRYGVVLLGVFLSTKTYLFLISIYLTPYDVASYGFTIQILDLIGYFSMMLFGILTPYIINSRVLKDSVYVFRIFSIIVSGQALISFIALLYVILFGKFSLNLLGLNSILLTNNFLIPLASIMFIEWITSTFLNFIMTENKIPYAISSFLTGLVMTLFSFVVLKYMQLGLFEIIAIRFLISFLYSIYWINYSLKKNSFTFIGFFKYSFKVISDELKKHSMII